MNTVIAVARFEAAEETGMFRFFRGALLLLRIRLLQCPGIETLAETILFRSPGDCSILVQNLTCT